MQEFRDMLAGFLAELAQVVPRGRKRGAASALRQAALKKLTLQHPSTEQQPLGQKLLREARGSDAAISGVAMGVRRLGLLGRRQIAELQQEGQRPGGGLTGSVNHVPAVCFGPHGGGGLPSS
jgi:hypothetical protein